jgi:(E)-4-hydroxy-3-methyl-but-2-enyl pyrophosphate reductase/ribosomal protein S1
LEIIIAKSAGFCFGVDNAVKKVYEMLKTNNKQIYTFGPIIHNEQVVNYLREKGVRIIKDINDLDDIDGNIDGKGHIVIRAHGVTPIIYKKIKDKGLILEDATCPYVKKIHNLVEEKSNEGYRIIIVGDKNHPEVIGINGWCNNNAYIINSVDDVKLIKKTDEKVCVVAQTTITKDRWHEINECLKEKFENILKFDTICSATSKRQSEVEEISKTVDVMIIIGDRNSSNTQKLCDISKKHCAMTFKVETSADLPQIDVEKIKKIGISAGASTPDWVIEEVIKKMSELNNQEVTKNEENNGEINFADALEDSFVRIQAGDIIKGKVIGFNANEVFVDLGYKADGIISLEEYTDIPDFQIEKEVKIGDEIEVFVQQINDGEGNVRLSKKQVEANKAWEEVEKAYEDKTPLKAIVIEVVNGGVVASYKGVRIFVPGSQLSDRYVKDLREYLKRTIELRLIDFNEKRRKLVGSARVILEERKEKASKEIWGNIEVGKSYSGVVKSLTKFGAFVDIGGVDGLIHVSELSWSRIDHPSEILKVGDTVEVHVLEFDKDKKKISLGYRKQEDNPWVKVGQMYKEGVIVTVKVLRMTPFGAFVEIIEGVDGLVHISQISNKRIAKVEDVLEVGMEVDAKIIEMDVENKKINLSIKEVKPIDPPGDSTEEAKEENKEETEVTEHKEEMEVTLADVVKTSE